MHTFLASIHWTESHGLWFTEQRHAAMDPSGTPGCEEDNRDYNTGGQNIRYRDVRDSVYSGVQWWWQEMDEVQWWWRLWAEGKQQIFAQTSVTEYRFAPSGLKSDLIYFHRLFKATQITMARWRTTSTRRYFPDSSGLFPNGGRAPSLWGLNCSAVILNKYEMTIFNISI